MYALYPLAFLEAAVEILLLVGLLVAIGVLVYWRGYHRKLRRLRHPRHSERHPYQGDAEDFERLLR